VAELQFCGGAGKSIRRPLQRGRRISRAADSTARAGCSRWSSWWLSVRQVVRLASLDNVRT